MLEALTIIVEHSWYSATENLIDPLHVWWQCVTDDKVSQHPSMMSDVDNDKLKYCAIRYQLLLRSNVDVFELTIEYQCFKDSKLAQKIIKIDVGRKNP